MDNSTTKISGSAKQNPLKRLFRTDLGLDIAYMSACFATTSILVMYVLIAGAVAVKILSCMF